MRVARFAAVILLALSLAGCAQIRKGAAVAIGLIPGIDVEAVSEAERLARKAAKAAAKAAKLHDESDNAADAPFRRCKAKGIREAGADLSELSLALIEQGCRVKHPAPGAVTVPAVVLESYDDCIARLRPRTGEWGESEWAIAHRGCLGRPE